MIEFLTFDNLLSLLTLSFLEIVLGVDNLIFIAIFTAKLPEKLKQKARIIGISLAIMMRIVMLLFASKIMQLTVPLFFIAEFPVSGQKILLILGGVFLIIKPLLELKKMLAGVEIKKDIKATDSFAQALIQIIFIDFILSFDSIITAVGMTNNLTIIIIAIIISLIVMLFSLDSVSKLIESYPSLKIMGLCFIILLGIFLCSAGFDLAFSKNYLYFAIFFTLACEIINIKYNKIK